MLKNVGRRKSSIARVNFVSGVGNIIINGKTLNDFVQGNFYLSNLIQSPLLLYGLDKSYDVFVDVHGGGLSGQSDAIKLAISRVLYNLLEIDDRKKLRDGGFLTRNSLVKERRKYGLKKARKAPQFSKR